MNNEETKTPGEALWRAVYPDLNWVDADQSKFEEWASAVISSVLQGAKWVLLEPGVMMLEGDETWSHFLWSWVPAARTRVCDADICRRPISLPSSVRPDGKSEGPASTPSVSSGDAGAGVPAVKLYPFRLEEAKKNLGNVVTAEKLPMRYVSTSNHNWFPHLFAAEGVATWAFDDNGKWDGIGNCSNLFMTTPTPIWQLPPPPAGHQWHMPDTVTAKELGEEHRLCVVGERISPGAQYFERGTSSWSSTSKSFSDPLGNTETYRVPITTPFPPLPQSAEPVAEEKLVPMNEVRKLADEAKDGINVAFRFLEACQRSLHQTESESDQLRKELEETREHLQGNLIASRNECQRLTTENAALKEKLDRWQVVGNSVMKVVTGKEGPLSDSDVEAELTRLRSQLTWTPVPLEGITRTDERNKLVVWVSDSTSETGLEWLHGISRRATHYISIESLRQFLPLPSPPETEEQKAGDSFNKWWQTKAHQDLAEVSGCNKATALAIWLAAKQSTGGPA